MSTLAPWARGPFELLLHAEMHLRDGNDFDRRIALIGFDNAIEVTITTYLTLNPLQRQNRCYTKSDCDHWLNNYHTKLDFLEEECGKRGIAPVYAKAEFVWYHDIRNGQYHGGSATIPQAQDLEAIRRAALWVFALLFDVSDLDAILEERVKEAAGKPLPSRTEEYDRLIDSEFGMVEIAGQQYYASEAIFGIDPTAYFALAKDIQDRDAEERSNIVNT
jgi:hypothetical protein